MAKDAFEEREEGEEAKFKLSQDMQFKAEARRNKYLGLWAAKKMGKTEAESQAYAKTVVASDLDEPGYEDVIRKVMGDFAKNKINVSEDEVRAELELLFDVAAAEVAKDFPKLL
jgi:hypothetical protein